MKTEYEVRCLEVSLDQLMQKLENMGATKVGAFNQKRYVYDFVPIQKGRWIRLRTNGKETTLTIKEIKSLRIDGTKELEITVSDFESTNEILNKLGYVPRTFQENFRIEYILNGISIDLDKWPMIPAFMEIEGKSEEDVYSMMRYLNIDKRDVTAMDVDSIYKEKYAIVLDDIKKLEFNEKEKQFIAQFK